MTAQSQTLDTPATRRVLIVEDDENLREALDASLCDDGFSTLCAANGNDALGALEQHEVDLVISDVQMGPMNGHELLDRIKRRAPELPVVLMTAYGTIQKAVDAMHCGAVDYLVKPFAAETLVETVRRYAPPPLNDETCTAPVAEDPRSRECLALARRVAASDATIMINGESGTGKEVYARFIHQNSQRVDAPFVAINCAAIPESMLEAVLFGHEKGAFTGAATARAGKFEQAQGGTLLLDEISEMDLGLQAKLLRVLQEKEVERIGGQAPLALDVRVLATTNRDLAEHVRAGRFREDLYYRLNVVPLTLPPLRERPGDILPLAQRCLERGAGGSAPAVTLCADAQARLLAYHWPGNVRELDNVMQRAAILSPDGNLRAMDIGVDLIASPAPPHTPSVGSVSGHGALRDDLRSREEARILQVLSERGMTRKHAAEQLGISARTLRHKIARMRDAGIHVPGARSA